MADWRTDDRELLARILMAEAGNQGPVGMTAVGNVIMNRASATGYGDGIRGVIMKPGQFSPMNSVTGYASGEQGQDIGSLRPSATSYMVADALLSGRTGDITGGATHFFNPDISNPSWASGKQFSRIGDHVFGSADAGRGNTQATTTTQGASPMMQEEQQPRGLLGSLGIQKMEEGAAGETGQRFYERDTFKDTAATLAQGFAAMGSSPALQKMTADIASQRSEAKARNKTVEYLRANGREDLADMIDAGQVDATAAMSSLFGKAVGATEEPAATRALRIQAEMAGLAPGTTEYQEFMLYGGGAPSNFRSLDMQARAAGYEPGTPEYERFMASRGAFEKTEQAAQATAETNEDQQLIEMSRNLPGLYDVVDELFALADVATYTAAGRAADELAKQAGLPASEGARARAEYIAIVDNQVLRYFARLLALRLRQRKGID